VSQDLQYYKVLEMTATRRTYDPLFKEKAIKSCHKRGDVIKVEKELGISLSLLSKWRKQYEKLGIEGFCGKGKGYLRLTPEKQKIIELERKAKESELKYEILEKGSKCFLKGKAMMYEFMLSNEKKYSIIKMCSVLGVGKLGYHRWKNQYISHTQRRIMLLKQEIVSIFNEAKQRYGSGKIALELQNRGYKITTCTVGRYMIQLGLQRKMIKKFKITTDSNHNYYIAPNLLKRQFKVTEPCTAWVSDITYLPTTKGFLYLTIILDLFDRKIIGWNLSSTMKTKLTTIPAWEMAVTTRKITNELIFHSDRGTQYANKSFSQLLDSYSTVKRSMSRKRRLLGQCRCREFFWYFKKGINT